MAFIGVRIWWLILARKALWRGSPLRLPRPLLQGGVEGGDLGGTLAEQFVGRLQFAGALVHQNLEVVAVHVEFGGDPLLFRDVFHEGDVVADLAVALAHRCDLDEFDVGAAVGPPICRTRPARAGPGAAPPTGAW